MSTALRTSGRFNVSNAVPSFLRFTSRTLSDIDTSLFQPDRFFTVEKFRLCGLDRGVIDKHKSQIVKCRNALTRYFHFWNLNDLDNFPMALGPAPAGKE